MDVVDWQACATWWDRFGFDDRCSSWEADRGSIQSQAGVIEWRRELASRFRAFRHRPPDPNGGAFAEFLQQVQGDIDTLAQRTMTAETAMLRLLGDLLAAPNPAVFLQAGLLVSQEANRLATELEAGRCEKLALEQALAEANTQRRQLSRDIAQAHADLDEAVRAALVIRADDERRLAIGAAQNAELLAEVERLREALTAAASRQPEAQPPQLHFVGPSSPARAQLTRHVSHPPHGAPERAATPRLVEAMPGSGGALEPPVGVAVEDARAPPGPPALVPDGLRGPLPPSSVMGMPSSGSDSPFPSSADVLPLPLQSRPASPAELPPRVVNASPPVDLALPDSAFALPGDLAGAVAAVDGAKVQEATVAAVGGAEISPDASEFRGVRLPTLQPPNEAGADFATTAVPSAAPTAVKPSATPTRPTLPLLSQLLLLLIGDLDEDA